ncbi:MAG: HRDC domain-containing protein [Ruminococcus callidus]
MCRWCGRSWRLRWGQRSYAVRGGQRPVQKLRQLRAAQAKHEGIPPYFIFSDATLRDMCRKKPQNLSEMRQVSGVGVIKAQKYGKMFLEELQQFLAGVQQ